MHPLLPSNAPSGIWLMRFSWRSSTSRLVSGWKVSVGMYFNLFLPRLSRISFLETWKERSKRDNNSDQPREW
ncbi:hypothetical protein E2C01_091118 [Portunus trituberculatus]|uniref:Uncharacterized protein n=1 Tax=Portunus trituberculatus TaxID=210409 RepID=A0A5B7JS55_PORTR|nr:hypothetical protein [Portunus trituberculatus]